jgi:DNA repair exonuclease SbcCD ATPase subunit
MKIKHKVIKEFQYLSPDKKIFILKIGTILEEYNYRVKTDIIPIDKDIIDNNPEFFEVIDWKAELLSYMRAEKLPQPAQLGKKIIPFIEEMILSSISQSQPQGQVVDEYQIKELERKEKDLNNREFRIKDKEEEIEIRISRVEKREESYKEDLKLLDKKEDELRERNKILTEKQIDLEDKTQDLNEKERNFDRSVLQSADELDTKYADLQKKIDSDLELVTQKEKDLEVKSKDISKRESDLEKRESDINDKIRDFEIRLEEFKIIEEDNRKLSQEISDWENLHWKLQRITKPPSAIEE